MSRRSRTSHASLIALFLLLATAFLTSACGGGQGKAATPNTTTPGGNTNGGGTTAANPLKGGVLATFVSNNEQFACWITEPATAQALADAWNGTGPAITSICCRIDPGSGQGAHNAPWSFSLPPASAIGFSGLCVGCAFAWTTPSQAEAGITTGPPYNCVDVNAGATWGMARMGVALTAFQDHR